MKLAQINIATAKYPLDGPELKDFIDNLDRINGIAEQSEGFVWRLKDDTNNATSIQAFENPNTIVNMSVWQSVDALKQFMFMTDHLSFMKRKGEWFEKSSRPNYVLWYVEDDHIPTLEEALDKLQLIEQQGPSEAAFDFKKIF